LLELFGNLLKKASVATKLLSIYNKNPEIINELYTGLKEIMKETKFSVDADFREENTEKILYLVISVQNPNDGVMAMVQKLQVKIKEMENNYGQIFLGGKIRIILETKDKRTYYLN
jgi:hypothetical protein